MALLASFVAFAPNAWAHHANVDPATEVVCGDDPDTFTVNYTITSWHNDIQGSNPAIVVDASVNEGPWEEVGGDAFPVVPPPGDPPSFSDSFDVPDASTVTSLRLRVRAEALWGNGQDARGPWPNPPGYVDLALPPNGCEPPPEPDPSVGEINECAEGGVSFELINNGDAPATFTVNGVDVVVGANSTLTHVVPVDENETKAITITSGGETLFDEYVTRDCLHPAPAVTVEACAEGGIAVMLDNSQGDDTATFRINDDPGIAVPAGETRTEIVPAAENTTVHIKVTAEGVDEPLYDADVRVNCLRPFPKANFTPCAEGGILVTLDNTQGEDAVTFVVNGERFRVGAGQSTTTTVEAAENETVHLLVTTGGANPRILIDQDVTRDCLQPAPVVTVDECAEGGIRVTLDNTDGDDLAVFDINGDQVRVPAGETRRRLIDAAEDATVQITVTSGGQTLIDEPVTRNCEHPSPKVVDDPCAPGGVGVTLDNTDGSDDATFVVNGTEVVVPAGQTKVHIIAAAENTTVHLLVTSDGQTLLDKDAVRDCQKPAASVTHACTSSGATVSLSNEGTEPVDLTVNRNGTAVETVTVGAGQTVGKTYAMAEDETASFRVTGPSFDSGSFSITRNCVEVGGVQLTKDPTVAAQVASANLASTGSPLQLPMLLSGLALMLGSGFMLLGSRRRAAAS
ncbi:MAG: hypothetical protein ACRD0U_11165 [Acidimicrobiales bacterium]